MLNEFDSRERKILRALTTPTRIQEFLDCEIAYNIEPNGDTCIRREPCCGKASRIAWKARWWRRSRCG